jgi:hypothetical protein
MAQQKEATQQNRRFVNTKHAARGSRMVIPACASAIAVHDGVAGEFSREIPAKFAIGSAGFQRGPLLTIGQCALNRTSVANAIVTPCFLA